MTTLTMAEDAGARPPTPVGTDRARSAPAGGVAGAVPPPAAFGHEKWKPDDQEIAVLPPNPFLVDGSSDLHQRGHSIEAAKDVVRSVALQLVHLREVHLREDSPALVSDGYKKLTTTALATGATIVGAIAVATTIALLTGGASLVAGGGAAVATMSTSSAAAAGVGGAASGVAAATVAVAGVATAVKLVSTDGSARTVVLGDGEHGRKVGLVRPNVVVDAEWEPIVAKLVRTSPAQSQMLLVYPFDKNLERLRRRISDKDIIDVAKIELRNEDKIFLLVSRGLNDKKSTASFMHKQLVVEVRDRASKRKAQPGGIHKAMDRSVRLDVHAVIKHVTAALLEDRPELCASPAITELSATCVESLVLSDVYQLVMDEIARQTESDDRSLSEKISKFKEAGANFPLCQDSTVIDQTAITALQSIPAHCTVAGKLRCCVEALETVADHGPAPDAGADWLLGAIISHIIHADVPRLNAECLFLEEFVRDEELLRGAEGYALVTLLAALNYLKRS